VLPFDFIDFAVVTVTVIVIVTVDGYYRSAIQDASAINYNFNV
jgi:uncharacterized membrane protein YqjE